MKRRHFVFALTGMCAMPRAIAQQRPKLWRIAVMTSPAVPNRLTEAFRSGMQELGYVEGKTVEFFSTVPMVVQSDFPL
jgi:hypothetical protein